MEIKELINTIKQKKELIKEAANQCDLESMTPKFQAAYTLMKEYEFIIADLLKVEACHTDHSYVIIKRDDGSEYSISGDKDRVCHMACKCEIFSDCTDESIVRLVVDGEGCIPPSWEPDMIRRIVRKKDHECIFENQYLNWDH